MKRLKLICLATIASFAVAACEMIPTVTPFSPVSQTVEMNAAGAEVTVAFSAPGAWTASCEADWLSLSATSGAKGTNALTLSARPNESGAERRATISLSAAEVNENGTIIVVQKAGSATPSDDPSTDPSDEPSSDPSDDPSDNPSEDPSTDPSTDPSDDPSDDPSKDPSTDPSDDPSKDPSTDPSDEPGEPPIDGDIEDWGEGEHHDLEEE